MEVMMNPTPYVMSLEPGSHYFCACGRSANLPFCDGTHQGSGVEPFAVDIVEPQTVAICACHQSANRPFCDGTHKSLTAE
jgi:CDGSH-type Zn-finger protein